MSLSCSRFSMVSKSSNVIQKCQGHVCFAFPYDPYPFNFEDRFSGDVDIEF